MEASSLGDAVERKLATVLFADLVGATGIGESLDVEQLRDLLDLFFAAVRDEVEERGGTVGQFVGDAVLALFGVPATREDDVDRALTAALGILDRLQELNEKIEPTYGVRLAVRIGVNTGELVVPLGETLDLGTIAGDAVNVAARLQDEAESGSVLVAGRTVRASRRFLFEDRGTIELRGRRRPIHYYELVGERLADRRTPSLAQTPMVGRHTELDQLSSLFDDVVSSLTPRVVTVTGTAGLGKSRLVEEFLSTLASRANSPQIHRGSCLSFGEELPYRPLIQSLRARVGIMEGDDPESAFEQLAKASAELRAGPEGRQLAAVLASTVGIGDPEGELTEYSSSQLGRAIRSGWRTYFSALAEEGPVVVVIEDLHWADPALVEMVDLLGRDVEGPVLFLVTARPQIFDEWPLWSSGDNHKLIRLEALDQPDAVLLLRKLVGAEELPASFEEQVLTRAEGNPFYVEEIVGHLVDHRQIRIKDGHWEIPEDMEALEIPDTVQAVLAARIDLLDPIDKRALQLAAVIGRTFWAEAVAALLEANSETVRDIMDRLEDRDFLRHQPTSMLAAQEEFEFKHILTREVAYAGLSRRDRSRAHGRAFVWIERSGSGNRGEVLDLLAYHATRSYEAAAEDPLTADSTREALRGRAFEGLMGAAEAARLSISLEKARTLGEYALELAAAGDLARAHQELGETALFAYAGDEAWRHFREAIDLRVEGSSIDGVLVAGLCARALETPVRWPGTMLSPPPQAEVHHYLRLGFEHAGTAESAERARLLMLQSFWQHAYPPHADTPQLVSPDESLASGEEAAAIAHRLDLPVLESAALDGVASTWIPLGRYDRALAATRGRLALADRILDPWELGDIHAMGGWLNYHIGRYADTFRFGDAGFTLTVDEIPSVALHCVTWRALARYKMGAWEELFADLVLARDLLGDRKDEPPHFASPMFAAAAVAHELRGEPDEADAILQVLRSLHEKADPVDRDASPLARWASFMAILYAHRGLYEDAERMITETTWRKGTRRGLLLQARCRLALERSAWEEAETIAAEAQHEAATCGLEALAYEADLLAGRTTTTAGDFESGLRLLRGSIDGFGSLEAVWDEARARLALAESLIEAGQSTDALVALEPAVETYAELGMVRDLESARNLQAAAV